MIGLSTNGIFLFIAHSRYSKLIYQSQFLAKLVSLTLSLCLLLAGPQVYAGSFFNQLMDKDDGWFDASDWVLVGKVMG